MGWAALKSERDVAAFIDAAVVLHRPLFERIPAGRRPFFFDYWLRLFNHSRAWAWGAPGRPEALVTVPRHEDAHPYRWQTRTLALGADAARDLTLPEEVDLERSFLMPVGDGDASASPLANTTRETVGLGYVRSLDGLATPEPSEWRPRRLRADDLEIVLDLMERGYAELNDPDIDIGRQRDELCQMLEHGAGWCYCVTAPGGTRPVAVVSYVAIHVPLAGVPAALVGDLAVDASMRRRGVASTLQRYAYDQLRRDGVEWVYGNIDPGNLASRRQAETTGRTIWFNAVRFRPA